MYYDYLEMQKEELVNLYKENINSIKYYQNKIDRENKILIPILLILFVSILTFGEIGIYYCFENKVLQLLIGFLYLIGVCFAFDTDMHYDDNLRIELIKQDNSFIYFVLLDKYNFDVILEKQT